MSQKPLPPAEPPTIRQMIQDVIDHPWRGPMPEPVQGGAYAPSSPMSKLLGLDDPNFVRRPKP